MYPIPNVSTEHYDVFTDAGPCAAFRAPGQVQGIFALEQALDEMAHAIDMDPLALREKIDTNDTDDARARKVERRIGAERAGWSQRRPAGRRHRARQTRHRHGAIAVGVHRPRRHHHLRSANSRRRLGRCADGRAGHRHRHAHGHGADGGGRARIARRGRGYAHRRFALPARPGIGRQPRHRLDHARSAQRCVPCRARSGSTRRSVARRQARSRSSFRTVACSRAAARSAA